jgi:hypothetical protein
LESVLSGAGNEVRYHEAGIDDLQSPQLARSEPLAVLGGPHSPLRFLERVPVLHWHGDTFDLPEGAELLASTSLYRNQSFRYGKSVLAFQFHPEASTKNFERCFDRPCRRDPQHDRDFGPQVALPDSTAGGGVGTPGAAMPSRMAERTRRMQPTLEGVLSSQWLVENMFWGRRREMGCGL